MVFVFKKNPNFKNLFPFLFKFNKLKEENRSCAKIEKWRSDVLSSIKDMGKYIDIEEIIVDDIGYDDLLGNYNISGVDLKSNPFVMIDEFDERVWVYRLDQTDKIKERIKTILSEGISYFNY